MPLVASVDYPNKRIYLSAETVNSDLDTLLVYKEVRALRVSTPGHRLFKPLIYGGGNIAKIPGQTYTAAFTLLASGARIVPFNGQAHKLRVIRDTFTEDGVAGRDCFDRTSLVVNVDIDIDFPEIEIRVVNGSGVGSAPTKEAIATQVRAELSQELSRIDTLISSRQPLGQVDANIKKINGVSIIGTGVNGDKWRPST